MVARNFNLGGEQSGHIIFRDFTTTGDGIISALQILRIMHATGQPLSKLKACLKKYPQAQRNLIVKAKPPLEDLREVMKLQQEVERDLGGKGRVLLRYSGTEPKIRLLIEGREFDKIDQHQPVGRLTVVFGFGKKGALVGQCDPHPQLGLPNPQRGNL